MIYNVDIDGKKMVLSIKKRNMECDTSKFVFDEASRERINDLFAYESSYKIQDFFKNEKESFLVLISMLAAMFVFIGQVMAYLYYFNIFTYWGVDTAFIHLDPNIAVYLGVFILFGGISFIIPFLIRKIMDEYAIYNGMLFVFKRYIHISQKKLKESREINKKVVRAYNVIKRIDKKGNDIINQGLKEFSLRDCEIGEWLKQEKKTLKRLKLKTIPKIVISFVICFFFYFVLFIMIGSIIGELNYVIYFGVSAAMSASTCLSVGLMSYLKYVIPVINEMKRINDICLEYGNSIVDKLLTEFVHVNQKESLLTFFNDQKIKTIVLDFGYLLLAIIVTLFLTSSSQKENRTEFYLYEDKDISYVLLYSMDDKYILMKADIDNDNEIVNVYCNNIRIEGEPISLEKHKFRKAIRIMN